MGALAVINITDDGVGDASLAKGHGLSGLVDRLAGVDGTLTLSSPAGGPTVLTATIPQQS